MGKLMWQMYWWLLRGNDYHHYTYLGWRARFQYQYMDPTTYGERDFLDRYGVR